MSQSKRDCSESIQIGSNESLLRAQLAIEPPPESGCPVVEMDGPVRDVEQTFKMNVSNCEDTADWDCLSDCGECHAKLGFEDCAKQEPLYLKSAVTATCLCPIFEKNDCIGQIKTVTSGSLIVTVTVPTRGSLRDLISELRATGATVTLEWLIRDHEDKPTTEFDVSSLTDKQQEALRLALESGYYETPREINLAGLADVLGISKSATSQRLNAAETKLVKAFLEE